MRVHTPINRKLPIIKKFYILLFLINLLLFLLFSNTIYCIIGCSALIAIWIINNILCTRCSKQLNKNDNDNYCDNCIAVRLKHKNIFDKIILFILKWINGIKKVK